MNHILKAKEKEPENPQLYSILSSIYLSAGMIDLALASIENSVKHSLRSPNAHLLQMAICLRHYSKFTDSIQISLSLLSNNPKFTEAFINYFQCIIMTNTWTGWEENMKNLNIIAEYHSHTNKIATSLNNFISHYSSLSQETKSWIQYTTCLQDIQNAKYSHETRVEFEIKKEKKKFKTLKVGFLIDDIKDSYDFFLVSTVISFMNEKSKLNTGIQAFFIIYESSSEQDCYSWLKEQDYEALKFYIVDLSSEESPRSKADLLKTLQFDILIFLEYLSHDHYGLLNRKIYQTFAMRPSNFQIILPFDGCSRHEDIFDYLITEEYLTNEKTMSLYKEKLILLENSSLFCVNPYLDLFKKNLDEAENPFENYKKQGYKILGNFSDCYKIDIEIFSVWCQILSKIENTILVLKFCNEESSKNLKSFASDQGIDPDRLIFYIIDSASKYSSAPYIKYIDVYLDIQTLTGDYEVFFCLFSGVPIVVMSNEVYGQSSKLSTSIVCSGKEGSKIANGKEEYIHQAIKFLTIKPKRLYNDWSPLNIFLDTFYHVLKDFKHGKM